MSKERQKEHQLFIMIDIIKYSLELF